MKNSVSFLPVFATPNFIDRMNNNLMGLMTPDPIAVNIYSVLDENKQQ